MLFSARDYQTTIFSETAGSFFAALERRQPDVVIAGLDLPDEGRMAFLRHIKAMHTATPEFLLAGCPDVARAVAAMKAGVLDVITKPYDAEQPVLAARHAPHADVHVGTVGR